ncbi:MAG: hypothetical protein ACLSVD_04010 [Eggerthellaceae bacterium]
MLRATLAGTDTDANNVISLRLDVQKFYAEAENRKNHGGRRGRPMQRCTCARLRRHPKSGVLQQAGGS